MRITSVFCAECICGFRLETPDREFTCPNCERPIVLEWAVIDDNARPETSEKKAGSEAVA